jgi:hypothetical protein
LRFRVFTGLASADEGGLLAGVCARFAELDRLDGPP